MVMSAKVLLVDGTQVLYRSAYATGYKLGSKEPVFGPTTIATCLGIIRSIAWKFLPKSVYVVWDGGRSERRMQLLPTYKSGRRELTEEVKVSMLDDILSISSILEKICCRVTILTSREADDLISYLSKRFINPIIISDDTDYMQLIQYGVSVYRPTSDSFVSKLTFKNKFGVEPESYLIYKALVGDDSDSIEGIKGIGPVYAKSILSTNPPIATVKELSENAEREDVKKRISQLVLTNLPTIERNVQLLDTSFEILTSQEVILIENSMNSDVKFDESVVYDLERVGLSWITEHFTQWSSPFRRLI